MSDDNRATITYRQASEVDLAKLVEVHQLCFPKSYSTLVGAELLQKLYNEYFLENKELFLIAEDNLCNCIGFVMGTFSNSKAKASFISKNKTALLCMNATLILKFNKLAIKKVILYGLRKFTHSNIRRSNASVESMNEQTVKQACATLVSIAVLPKYEGLGIGAGLLFGFESLLKKHNYRVFQLGVMKDNERAIRFYVKCGLEINTQSKYALSFIKHIEIEDDDTV